MNWPRDSRGILMAVVIMLLLQWRSPSQQSHAQPSGIWNKIDTVTAGPSQDINPTLVHTTYGLSWPGISLWTVFERHTASESQIAATKFNRVTATWDTSVVVVSAAPVTEEQKYPDYSEVTYFSSHILRLVAWQTWKGNRWQLFYATLQDSAKEWSAPIPLVTDTLDNTSVQVRPLRDSVFIITWKRANTIMALYKTPSTISPPETVAVSSADSMEYDIFTQYGRAGIVWSSGVEDKGIFLYRRIIVYPKIQISPPETLAVPPRSSNPRLFIAPLSDPMLLMETQLSANHEIFFYLTGSWPGGFDNLSRDSLADNRNARAFRTPMITKQGSFSQSWIPGFDVCVYEKYRDRDSALVFLHYSASDTVRSPGHNRNPSVGTQPVFYKSTGNILVVWESNRSGSSHIYSRLVPMAVDDVRGRLENPLSFELLQNYPNPFNPTTAIGYRLPTTCEVTLQIFDLLGRSVATLVDERRPPGNHTVTFDGSRLSSGMYFSRLQAGGNILVRKMMLLR